MADTIVLPTGETLQREEGTEQIITPSGYTVSGGPTGRIMSSIAGHGGLAGPGGIAGPHGGIAG